MSSPALERFLRYIQVDTTSDPESKTHPSSEGQKELARLLAGELTELGLEEVNISPESVVTATLPASAGFDDVPVIGWIAHMDTAPGTPGRCTGAEVLTCQGGPITLDSGTQIPESSYLRETIGSKIVVTDGTTLLGADDKAGIAAIITAAEQLLSDKSLEHGKIRIAFTTDEEIGEGVLFLDPEQFGADWALTVDGERTGTINRETFSAERAVLTVEGVDIHPGAAKDVMVNAVTILADILCGIPKELAAENSCDRQPYINVYESTATIAEASAQIILRSFDDEGMEKVRAALINTVNRVRDENPKAKITLRYEVQYRNMREKLDERPEILKTLEEAVRKAGIDPVWVPVRGGTDGSVLTEKGLPTPNLFTGGANYHSTTEWLSVEGMEAAVRTLVALALLAAKKG